MVFFAKSARKYSKRCVHCINHSSHVQKCRTSEIMAVSINEICENTKLAREMALMGNYDTSGVYYQGVVQQIHRLLATIEDPTRKAKWQVVQHQIAEEFEKVKATSNTLQLFKVDTHAERLVGTAID